MNSYDFATLKAKQRNLREGFPETLGLRIHRALSWLQRAEQETEDRDAAFIFLWIAFNAAYADARDEALVTGERSRFEDYFARIVRLDGGKLVYKAIWQRFSGAIRLLLENQYVFQPFWNHQNGLPGHGDWEERFRRSKVRAQTAIAQQDTKLVLAILFDRLYVLRNQMVHGGATWNSSVNRAQVGDGAQILGFLVPLFIDLMMDHPEEDWGAPHYPVVS